MNLPWKTKGIVLTAPLSHEVDDVVKFIDDYLAPNGCNLICLQIRYRYRFKLHPECMGYDPLSFDDVKKLVKGLMIESYIEDGAQKSEECIYGKSITDPCLGWEKTEKLIYDLADTL